MGNRPDPDVVAGNWSKSSRKRCQRAAARLGRANRKHFRTGDGRNDILCADDLLARPPMCAPPGAGERSTSFRIPIPQDAEQRG